MTSGLERWLSGLRVLTVKTSGLECKSTTTVWLHLQPQPCERLRQENHWSGACWPEEDLGTGVSYAYELPCGCHVGAQKNEPGSSARAANAHNH